jgi:demethylmenaquinone methyltransferase/2-methoxy-6-polyprenyl-1,4-benzoquinol methylase
MPSTPAADRPRNADSAAWTGDDLAADPHRHAEKAAKVQRMFGAIAGRYDLNNRLHSFGRDQAWRRATVRMAEVREGERVLDCACGTGDLTRLFAKSPAAEVVGADFTPQMLDIAREKTTEAGVDYREADAMALPFDDASFDVVSIAFGIRNVAEPPRAMAEFHRVLRPDGRLVILEFSQPRNRLLRWGNRLYTNTIMPRTATLLSGDRSGAYYYLPRSVETFMEREDMARAMTDAGFTDIRQKPMTFGVVVCHRGVKRA